MILAYILEFIILDITIDWIWLWIYIYILNYIHPCVCVCDYIYMYLWWDIPGSSCLTFSLPDEQCPRFIPSSLFSWWGGYAIMEPMAKVECLGFVRMVPELIEMANLKPRKPLYHGIICVSFMQFTWCHLTGRNTSPARYLRMAVHLSDQMPHEPGGREFQPWSNGCGKSSDLVSDCNRSFVKQLRECLHLLIKLHW